MNFAITNLVVQTYLHAQLYFKLINNLILFIYCDIIMMIFILYHILLFKVKLFFIFYDVRSSVIEDV